MSWRKLLFLSWFLAVPGALWLARVVPLQERRGAALQQFEQAQTRKERDTQVIQERDQLAEDWLSFRPLAETELVNLGNDLNPILLQNRVLQLAKRLDCSLQLQEQGNRADGGPLSYQLSGSGRPLQVHDFLDYLERGDARGRIEAITVVYAAPDKSGLVEAFFNGVLIIAQVPAHKEAQPESDA